MMSSSDDLVEELFCPICADLFKDPHMLPCTHSFCRKCLIQRIDKGLVTRKSAHVSFDCPVCREEVTLDDHGVSGLPRNRLLKKMVEMHRGLMERSSETPRHIPASCEDHGKELGAFCAGCRQVVCIDCIVGEHKGHVIESVDEVYQKRKKSLKHSHSEMEEELQTLTNIEADERLYIKQLEDNCQQKITAIELQFDEYIALLQQSKESILAELVTRQHKEVATIQKTMSTLLQRKEKLKDALNKLEQSINLDKMDMLKEPKLDCSSRSRFKKSASSEAVAESLRSPRTHCFLECTLKLDTASLQSAINNAHLDWDTEPDLYSPKHLAGRYSQLYDTEWKSAYLESTVKVKDDIVTALLNILEDAFRQAKLCCEHHLDRLTYHMLQPEVDVHVGDFSIHGYNTIEPDEGDVVPFCNVKESLRKLRAQHTSDFMDDIVFMIHPSQSPSNQPTSSLGNRQQLSAYVSKCFEICFMLFIQDPPLYVDVGHPRDGLSDKDSETYKYVKRRGRKTKTLAWPPLYLYKGGPIIAKGVILMPG